MSSATKRVKVFVRFRPTADFCNDSIRLLADGQTINLQMKSEGTKPSITPKDVLSFKLDGVLNNASQEEVYHTIVHDIVSHSLHGYNGTVLAYGQTGAGKTYTITGATANFMHRGIIPRAIGQIFATAEEQSERSLNICISYMEIYNETMFDLLSTLSDPSGLRTEQLKIEEDKRGAISVKGLSIYAVTNEADALSLLFEGETNRAVASHALNNNSSRSHCIFTIYIESKARNRLNSKNLTSKLHLVDLAGSERMAKTKADAKVQREANFINKSLAFLEHTVAALGDSNITHRPYRDTKLTHILKDSIGGKCCTTMIANVYGEAYHIDETLSTLRFAMKILRVPVEAVKCEQFDPWILVEELREEIKYLKLELDMHNTLINRGKVSYGPLSEGEIVELKKQIKMYIEGRTTMIDVASFHQIDEVFAQFRNVVTEMERQFRHKFVLHEKRDSDTIDALLKSGVTLDEAANLARTSDTSLPAPASPATRTPPTPKQRPSPRRKSNKKPKSGTSTTSRTPASPSSVVAEAAVSKSLRRGSLVPPLLLPSDETELKMRGSEMSDTMTEDKKTSRPSTPPTRAEAFDDYKKDQGFELNQVFIENKTTVLDKRRAVRDLGKAVNVTKRMIDQTREALKKKRNERLAEGGDETGEVIIEEEEYVLMTRLKNLKETYKSNYTELHYVKAEIGYCQQFVDQCRIKLLQEFDEWYNESFKPANQEANGVDGNAEQLQQSVPTLPKTTDELADTEDPLEKFDRKQQAILMAHPESAAFYNAKLKTRRRQILDRAKDQGQPVSRKTLPDIPQTSVKRKPGMQLSFAC